MAGRDLIRPKRLITTKPEKQDIMTKFMSTHTVPAGEFSADQIRQFAQAAQNDATVKGYRSFANLTEGTILCVMEAPSKEAVTTWFAKMGMSFDRVTKVELEGDRGDIQAA
jgi:phage host-nuclease inhibitor protein Gam